MDLLHYTNKQLLFKKLDDKLKSIFIVNKKYKNNILLHHSKKFISQTYANSINFNFVYINLMYQRFFLKKSRQNNNPRCSHL